MDEMIFDFVNYLKRDKKSSANTLQSYTRDIRQFCDYIDSKNLKISDVKKDDVTSYIDYMQGCGKAVSSVSRSLA